MKISEHWLREWVDIDIDINQLAEKLTMAGLEVATVSQIVDYKFTDVVIGKVAEVKKHPDADRLHVCSVDVGDQAPLTIVCGAKNVRQNLKVPVAVVGAVLPGDFEIKKAKLRGVESYGMICSQKELGLVQDSSGIMELPENAEIGANVFEYLHLDDHLLEIELTPNRGDCLSILGVAREVSATTNAEIKSRTYNAIGDITNDKHDVVISEKSLCPRYLGRIIRNINSIAKTPSWMCERLERVGINTISPVVDVTNYVMLELGQPMHAFDLEKIEGAINVRFAKEYEELQLLDGKLIKLEKNNLVIADNKRPLALAGVMGGLASGVRAQTKNLFLESAYFDSVAITNSARQFGVQTDSSYRFERGVDYNLQRRAIERATELLLEIVGGEPGPITEAKCEESLPVIPELLLRRERIHKILGINISDEEVISILQRLEMQLVPCAQGWKVTVPSFRFDIKQEIDLIEELVRIYGYQNIPATLPSGQFKIIPKSELQLTLARIQNLLVDRGYHEVITYSFVDAKLQQLLDPKNPPLNLQNPISEDLSVMRTSIWPGLLSTVMYNFNRQQLDLRLFEAGLCFRETDKSLVQHEVLAGAITGNTYPNQWGMETVAVDFYDLKADIEAIFSLNGHLPKLSYLHSQNSALHPGKSVDIKAESHYIGCFGLIHPKIKQTLDIKHDVYLFELNLSYVYNALLPKFKVISKFPKIERDLAFLVDDEISAQEIVNCVTAASTKLLQNVEIFDIYHGKGVEPGKKSIALRLIFQDANQTLEEELVNGLIGSIVVKLKETFHIVLRG